MSVEVALWLGAADGVAAVKIGRKRRWVATTATTEKFQQSGWTPADNVFVFAVATKGVIYIQHL